MQWHWEVLRSADIPIEFQSSQNENNENIIQFSLQRSHVSIYDNIIIHRIASQVLYFLF